MARDIVLCYWARHLPPTVSLSTQVYKWVPANCWGKLNKLRRSDLRWTTIASHPREVEILLATSCYRNRDKLSTGSYEPVLAPRLRIHVHDMYSNAMYLSAYFEEFWEQLFVLYNVLSPACSTTWIQI